MIAEDAQFIIFCSILFQVSSGYLFGPSTVTGGLGGTIKVSCYYDTISANVHSRKFWCKMTAGYCQTIISTTPFIKRQPTHIEDFRDHFVITMGNLQPQDAGAYRCGIGDNNNRNYYAVHLVVSEGREVPSSSDVYVGHVRESVLIHCPTHSASPVRSLYWCKERAAACDTMINNSGYVHPSFWQRVLILQDGNMTGFSLLVNDLKITDSGFYRCGTDAVDDGSEWADVHLHIIHGKNPMRPQGQKRLVSYTGGPVQAQCQVPLGFGHDALVYWCRWQETGCLRLIDSDGFTQEGFPSRISLIPGNPTDRTYTLIMASVEVGDSGSYWCIITDGARVQSLSVDVTVLATTTQSSLGYTSSMGAHSGDAETPPSSTPSRGQPSTEFIQEFPNTPNTTDTQQDTTAEVFWKVSSRGQPSTGFSTAASRSPITIHTTQLDTTAEVFWKVSSRGQPSTGFSTAASSSPITIHTTQLGDAETPPPATPSRGQPSTKFTPEFPNSQNTTDTQQDISTLQDLSTDVLAERTVSPFNSISTSAPSASSVALQDTTAEVFWKVSSRGQPSTGFSTAASSSPITIQTTQLGLMRNSTHHSLSVSANNKGNSDRQVSRHPYLLIILISVLLLICIVALAILVPIIVKSRRKKANNPAIDMESATMMEEGGRRRENESQDDGEIVTLENNEDLLQETEL
ncbi:polymeric immunoglobulin receptor-like isoform X2 [Hyperolius riggenbachi]|uniref:polymeric immunoglobulin receptor-like isoform X2 n=1 Tax=Hyperolius riggenbachi TaxID=752182 RepID=UPI0035A352FC